MTPEVECPLLPPVASLPYFDRPGFRPRGAVLLPAYRLDASDAEIVSDAFPELSDGPVSPAAAADPQRSGAREITLNGILKFITSAAGVAVPSDRRASGRFTVNGRDCSPCKLVGRGLFAQL